MTSDSDDEQKRISVPDALKQGGYSDTITVEGIEISWDVHGGTCNFRGIPVVMMWVDSTLAGLMSGVQYMVGPERFNLALQAEGRKSVESDWLLISSYDNFVEGFAQLNLNAKIAGWGDWHLVNYDSDNRQCIFRVYNNWEGGYQKALGVCWGSGMLAGKLAGICSKLFKTNCWATQTCFIAKGDAYDEFVVAPSDRCLEQDIADLLNTDQATRADMAVTLRRLQNTEKILRESEHRYNQLVESIPVGVYTVDFNAIGFMRFTYVSPRFCELLDIEADVVLHDSQKAFDRIHPDDLDGLIEEMAKVRSILQPLRWEGRYIIRGQTRWVRISSDPTALPNGGSLWHGVISDITERKLAEQQLIEHAHQRKEILDNLFAYVALLDINGVVIEINKIPLERANCQREDVIGKYFYELPFWSYEQTVQSRLKQAIATAKQRIPQRYDVIVLMGEELVPIDFMISAVLDDNGVVTELLATGVEISERIKAEEQLRIAATAFESQEGMTVTDAEGYILRVNHAYCKTTGYSAQELIGQKAIFFNVSRHNSEFYQTMWQHLNRTGSWQGELWERRKNGEAYPIWLNISSVKDTTGTITHYIGTQFDITDRKKAENKINELAFFDQLTGLANRTLLFDRINQNMVASVRNSKYSALLLIDLDNFKILNDTLGHDIGDLLLKQVAQRLTQCVHSTDTVARLGGDEFVVMLVNLSTDTTKAAARTELVCTRLLSEFNQTYELKGYLYNGTASIGATLFCGQFTAPDDLLKQADLAMYRSKASGRNTFRFFDPEMESVLITRTKMENDLREAIPSNQLRLYYQGQYTEDGSLIGAEALVRWQHPQRGIVPPSEFIPLAEETGLIISLGQWVLRTACQRLAAWAKLPKLSHITIAVNVSARQFHERDFVKQVSKVLDETNANPLRLKLELTESLLVHDVEEVIEKMSALQAKGITFSLDDFGTGYSSLAYLKKLPLNQLKIDQSFVRDVLIDSNDATIAKAITALAHNLGFEVIAEGVENAEQKDFLITSGCCTFQGYLFCKPLPSNVFEEFVQSQLNRTN